MNKQLQNVSFEDIRYSNCWEDADILLEAFDLNSGSQVLSIASAGDNCFAMLTRKPKQIVAVDISHVQLYLCELKIAAIKNFDRDDYLKFAGFNESETRSEMYRELRSDLSEDASKYWDQHIDDIEFGIIHFGKFEKYFQLFKQQYLHKIHDQERVNELFQTKSENDQRIFHDQHWHTPEWQHMHKHFFGKQMMGDQGRDPEFLKHVDGDISEQLLVREKNHLRTVGAQKNYFLFYMVNNRFNEFFLPHYVREENYHLVKENLDRLVLRHGLIDQVIQKYPDTTHLNLSDIFEYMDDKVFKEVSQSLVKYSTPKAKFVYWNLMVSRNMAEILPDKLFFDEDYCCNLKVRDMGYFYKDLIVNIKR